MAGRPECGTRFCEASTAEATRQVGSHTEVTCGVTCGLSWRRIGRAAKLSLVGSILLLGGAATQARPVAALPDAPAVNESGGARPVAAWNGFCAKHPAECIVDTSQPAIIALNPAIWRTLTSVNRRVNARIHPITDMGPLGRRRPLGLSR